MANYTPDECKILLRFAENIKILADLAERNPEAQLSSLLDTVGLKDDPYPEIINRIIIAEEPKPPYAKYDIKAPIIDKRWLKNLMWDIGVLKPDNGYTREQLIRLDRVLLSIPSCDCYEHLIETYAGTPVAAEPRPNRPNDNNPMESTENRPRDLLNEASTFLRAPARKTFIETGKTDLIELVNQYGHTNEKRMNNILETLFTANVFVTNDFKRFTPRALRETVKAITRDNHVANIITLITTTRTDLFRPET